MSREKEIVSKALLIAKKYVAHNTKVVGIKVLDKHKHLTQGNKKSIIAMLNQNIIEGGTKLINYHIKKIGNNVYSVTIYEKYAKASREFDTRPESQIVKWYYQNTIDIEVIYEK